MRSTKPGTGSRLLAIMTAAACIGTAAYAQPGPTALRISWSGLKPTSLAVEAPDGDRPLEERGGVFMGEVARRQATTASWGLVARYPRHEAKMMLEIRPDLASLQFEIVYPAHTSCHVSHVAYAEGNPHSRANALHRMLVANHLLQLQSPNDCDADSRTRLIRARLQRNYDLARLSGYFSIVPEYREEFAAMAATLRQSAGDPRQARYAAALAEELAHIDGQTRGLYIRRLYAAQQQAQARGDFAEANYIVSRLASDAQQDAALAAAVVDQRVDLTRDAAFLANLAAPGRDDRQP